MVSSVATELYKWYQDAQDAQDAQAAVRLIDRHEKKIFISSDST